jgi:hypothetical protein
MLCIRLSAMHEAEQLINCAIKYSKFCVLSSHQEAVPLEKQPKQGQFKPTELPENCMWRWQNVLRLNVGMDVTVRQQTVPIL